MFLEKVREGKYKFISALATVYHLANGTNDMYIYVCITNTKGQIADITVLLICDTWQANYFAIIKKVITWLIIKISLSAVIVSLLIWNDSKMLLTWNKSTSNKCRWYMVTCINFNLQLQIEKIMHLSKKKIWHCFKLNLLKI